MVALVLLIVGVDDDPVRVDDIYFYDIIRFRQAIHALPRQISPSHRHGLLQQVLVRGIGDILMDISEIDGDHPLGLCLAHPCLQDRDEQARGAKGDDDTDKEPELKGLGDLDLRS